MNKDKEIKKDVLIPISIITIFLLVVLIDITCKIQSKNNIKIATDEYSKEIEKNIEDAYKTENAIKYSLTNIDYEIKSISKGKEQYDAVVNINCKARENLDDIEKSLLAYDVENIVPISFTDSKGHKISVMSNKTGESIKYIDTSVNGEKIHSTYSQIKEYESKKISDDEKGEVVAIAQKEVKSRLKSPSSAKFPWSFDEYTITKSGDIFTVNSYVEAKNSYGTLLKIKYIVQFTVTGKDKYIVNNVIIDE